MNQDPNAVLNVQRDFILTTGEGWVTACVDTWSVGWSSCCVANRKSSYQKKQTKKKKFNTFYFS